MIYSLRPLIKFVICFSICVFGAIATNVMANDWSDAKCPAEGIELPIAGWKPYVDDWKTGKNIFDKAKPEQDAEKKLFECWAALFGRQRLLNRISWS